MSKEINKYSIAAMILYYGVLDVIKQDLIEYTEDEKIKLKEIRDILKNEVLRADCVNSVEAKKVFKSVEDFYKNRKKEENYWDKLMIDVPDIFNKGAKKK